MYLTGSGTTGNVVLGNLIGTDVNGTAAVGNVSNGVAIQDGAVSNTVGGTAAGAGNVISGSGNAGLYINGTGTSGNVVLGNLIGTDINGTVAIGSNYGIVINGFATSNTVGGTASGAANVISGNRSLGMYLGRISGDVVLGNLIGVDKAGSAALANLGDGIILNGAGGNTIGGSAAGGNLISGNVGAGIEFSVGSVYSNTISFNAIGTNAAKTAALPNGVGLKFSESSDTIGPHSAADPSVNTIAGNTVELELAGGGDVLESLSVGPEANALGLPNGTGVLVSGSGNTVGGSSSGTTNVISGNSGAGVYLSGSGASGNVVLGNFIGTDGNGTAALANSGDGVDIFNAPANTIGGTVAGAANVISGNGISVNEVGIQIRGNSGNVVLGNFIGTDVHGTANLGNTGAGVVIAGAASDNTVGGGAAGARNIISANGFGGVSIVDETSTGNIVLGNFIGTDIHGTAALGNFGGGVAIIRSFNNTVGGAAVGAGNLISGNVGDGISITDDIFGNASTGNVVQGNLIGVNAGGTAALPNDKSGGANGIVITASWANTIGGTAAGARNVISGNTANGVEITGSGASGNVVLGNLIGTDVTGTAKLGNTENGVAVILSASRNTIGGAASGAGNVISGNSGGGIDLLRWRRQRQRGARQSDRHGQDGRRCFGQRRLWPHHGQPGDEQHDRRHGRRRRQRALRQRQRRLYQRPRDVGQRCFGEPDRHE